MTPTWSAEWEGWLQTGKSMQTQMENEREVCTACRVHALKW